MQKLCKAERVSGKKQVDFLFQKGERFNLGNFVIIWVCKEIATTYPAQILISVPKKKLAKATERNLIKRLLKEAYRKQKNIIYEALEKQKKQIQFAIIYQCSKPLAKKEIDTEINLVLNRLINKL